MRTRPIGPAGARIPVIGQGTWMMEADDRAAVAPALNRGLDLGMTHIDTAEMYGGGRVEMILAEAIGDRRDEIYLVSKVLPSNASRQGTLRACDRSLRRLQTDRLDLYLLHWPGRYPFEETVLAFDDLLQAGKILAFGVSNFDAAELEQAVEVAGGRIACNQVLYHLGQRAIEHRVIPACARLGVPLVAYSPFGQGRFPSRSSPGGRVLEAIAAARSATARQVALAFLTRRHDIAAIPKSSCVDHVEENAGAGELTLTAAEIDRIDAAFPLGRLPDHLPIL